MPMPWRCPACQIQIRHTYRGHVCRLELILDERAGRLTVAPLRDDAPDEKNRPTR
jgi:hypothetical protein